jgi:hypothetical protein
VGAGERFAERGPGSANSADIWRGRSSRTRELPKCARSTRGVFSSSGQWCGLIRSGCEPVHRGCLRFSSKTLSRTREPLAVSVIAQRLGGYPQRRSGHHQGLPRRRPGGRPPPRELTLRLHAPDARRDRIGFVAAKRIQRIRQPVRIHAASGRDPIHPQSRARRKRR